MTALEISKALALAIGWKPNQLFVHRAGLTIKHGNDEYAWPYRDFDYRDWNVAGPIAERYDAFPTELSNEPGWTNLAYKALNPTNVRGSTPQEAIAMAVIQGSKPW